ncbi:hypothetical protein [Candidatus Palauibacter irciniicola]|uniref:hypothetical protein n=1 Tax=Candidatus Palauibacter irciniicola TaxID=3056733 RepID=UPI003B01150F
MIRVLADSAHDAALIEEAVRDVVQVVARTGTLTGHDVRVECVVLGCRSPVPTGRLELMRKIKQEVPWAPIIVVTDPAPDIVRWLGETGVSDIVWFDEVRTDLRSRIEAQCRTAALFEWAVEIERSTLPPVLRSALPHSLRAATDRPVRSVKELADAVRRSPVTLSQAFRTSVAGESTLSRFLGALVILRAHQLRTSGLSWERVGEPLGFTRQTIHQKSKRWPGRPLKQLARMPRQHLLAKFKSDHVEPLLNGDAPARRDAAQRPVPTEAPMSTNTP